MKNYYVRYNEFSTSIGVSCCAGHTIALVDQKTFAGSWNEMLMSTDGFTCHDCENAGLIKLSRAK